jgi:hypothetical protein
MSAIEPASPGAKRGNMAARAGMTLEKTAITQLNDQQHYQLSSRGRLTYIIRKYQSKLQVKRGIAPPQQLIEAPKTPSEACTGLCTGL